MKRTLLICTMIVAVFAALAVAGPVINPWFEIESAGIVAGQWMEAPSLEAGIAFESSVSAAWYVDISATYNDADLLDAANVHWLVLEADIGFDQVATVNQTGSLVYGCSMILNSETGFTPGNAQHQYPAGIDLYERTTGFMLEGYVGPLTLWGGIDFPWSKTQILRYAYFPKFGIRVDFDLEL